MSQLTNLLLHEETKGCKKIFVIPTKTPYVIAIESKDTVSISYFVISDITSSQWNFYLANIHTWTAFHISKLFSGRKNTKKPKTRNAFTFQNYISGKGYYYSWGLCGWLTWHANNWKGISQIRWVRQYFTNQQLKIHCTTETNYVDIQTTHLCRQ